MAVVLDYLDDRTENAWTVVIQPISRGVGGRELRVKKDGEESGESSLAGVDYVATLGQRRNERY